MIELSKETRKRLRELKAQAYTTEIENHLLKLSKKFDDWKDKKIDCGDLNNHIHQFHNGIAKDLYNAYNTRGVHDLYMVSRGLALGLLQIEDIPTEVAERTKQMAQTLFEAPKS